MRRVLVIDDEPQIRKLLRISLERKEYEVYESASGFEGLQDIQTVRPDIILLDLGLPDMDGSQALAELRSWSDIPVIVLSVRDLERDIVSLLDAGADDYLTKPFNVGELLARMNASLRRSRPSLREPVFSRGGLQIDFDSRSVTIDGRDARLTPTEYSIIAQVARAGGRIVTQSRLLKDIWGPLAEEERGSLRVHIASIRKKIERDSSRPEYLITEPGIGYRIRSD